MWKVICERGGVRARERSGWEKRNRAASNRVEVEEEDRGGQEGKGESMGLNRKSNAIDR